MVKNATPLNIPKTTPFPYTFQLTKQDLTTVSWGFKLTSEHQIAQIRRDRVTSLQNTSQQIHFPLYGELHSRGASCVLTDAIAVSLTSYTGLSQTLCLVRKPYPTYTALHRLRAAQ